jgi:thiamine biosynthesis lipoprotein
VSSGGDVVVVGQRGDRPWKVGVQDPRGPDPFLALPVDTAALGGAVMSASDNESYFVVGGARYHSILDARTGLPATRCRSVTVLHKDPLLAEALARAVFVLGDKEGLQLVARVEGADAVVVTADNRVVLSRALANMAAARALQQRPPTDAP